MSFPVATFISSNRILVSRGFALAFFLLLLITESAQGVIDLVEALHEYHILEPLLRLP